jgi:hypothetical protein
VVLMDLRILHAVSANATPRPRMLLGSVLFRAQPM